MLSLSINEHKYDLVVVGGGAAGLLGGVMAARAGLSVVIIERMKKAGRKLLATGGGRCNITRDIPIGELLDGYYGMKNFVRSAIYNFQPRDIMEFFGGIGVACVADESNGVYPESNRAMDVFTRLKDEYLRCGGEIVCDTDVDRVLVEGGRVAGVVGGNDEYLARNVLLAGGGCSMKELGSDGSAFELARGIGHSIVQPVPGLVGLVTPELDTEVLAGVALEAVAAIGNGKKRRRFCGDILITHRGLSGPVILDISRFVSREIADSGSAVINISWKGYSREVWQEMLDTARNNSGGRSVFNLLCTELTRRFAGWILRALSIGEDTPVAELKRDAAERLVNYLGELEVRVSKTEGFGKSMVTSGGVSTKEINQKTMQSRIVENLYFAGEIIDIDGQCGGYNLEWAFASGRLAVQSILKSG